MKEEFEWIHSWCDHTDRSDLPRVVLVGDSITHNYQEIVRQSLLGKAYVDYISTSYSIEQTFYRVLIENFVKDSRYDLLHFNFGLHGKYIGIKEYKDKTETLLKEIGGDKKVILATSTAVYEAGNFSYDKTWQALIEERNAALREIAQVNGYQIDDLYAISKTIGKQFRHSDGTHYTERGYAMLAKEVVLSILNNI